MADPTNQVDSAERTGTFRRRLVGVVTSDKMDKTITVQIVRRLLEPKYKKFVRVRRHFKAHDERNEYHVGDRVEIQESRPLSRTKRWVVTRMIVAAAGREQ